jgi:hypothetical protein
MDSDAFSITIVSPDDGDRMVGFKAVASNGHFSGVATWWGYVADLLPLAEQLGRFPRAFGDNVKLRFAINCMLVFECTDRVGHVNVKADLSLIDGAPRLIEPPQSVALSFSTEAARIDSFASQLAALGRNTAQRASLGGNAP